jgi:hypothetical protein
MTTAFRINIALGLVTTTLAQVQSRVEAGLSASTAALWVVGGGGEKPGAWGCGWVALFLGDVNAGTLPSRFWETQI